MERLADVAGFAGLLALGAGVAWVLYAFGAWCDAVRPPRRTLGWALAQGLPADPGDLGFTFEDAAVRTDGTAMPCWWIAGRGGAGAPIVVLLHGHGRSRWDSLRRASAWVERAALVALPDLRGHGDAPGRGTLGRREPADVVRVLAEAEARAPGHPVILVGHSLGAVVAIHAAALRARAGVPVAEVHAFGPYDRVSTPFAARLRARGLPTRPVVGAVLALIDALDGHETPTHASAAALGTTRLVVWMDERDLVSPASDARAIASSVPHGELRVTDGIPHAELGVPAAHGAAADLTSARSPSRVPPPSAPAPPSAA
ncbi:MAG: alpha/beta hydrolase family protein [Phycisphaerales bacterium]|jgi:pimeloyl-ACP methyl ester carboxylesterase